MELMGEIDTPYDGAVSESDDSEGEEETRTIPELLATGTCIINRNFLNRTNISL